MNARWQALADRFAARSPRERKVIGAVILLTTVFVGYTFWVEPGQLRRSIVEKQLADNQQEITKTESVIAGLKGTLTDPDAENRQALAQARADLAAAEKDWGQYEGLLIKPEQIPQLLRSLLARRGSLSLVSLQSQSPTPLVPPKDKKGEPAQATTAGGGIYKHGIEITVSGNYLDLLAYVADLEHAPQKLLWGKMALTATEYPRCELTLTLYTLSRDSRWLVL